ncbi:PP2C family protein-serine/threonine phosphatase [Candidatus Oscillochloris fontis]|uniref:PP2C family protein-serine/threonine phosphatase n=1 Tax=Candidatus Oscillochloris fontis TaxID=2496868 RepID=UPI00101C2C17|nr:PP2C family serine/threonine-protein phosphatase [Candidatus Oscillochloris fontis]
MRVRFSARSDIGMRREVNQDAYGTTELSQATLLLVCDGMGGHAAGEVASRLAVDTILATFVEDAPPDTALRQAFVVANETIYREGRGSMGTTGVAALLRGDTLFVANVGDSRAYLIREGQISQISRDHSFVSDQVAAGLMTPEQARTSNVRNIITRALGYQAEVQVDTFNLALLPGDTVVLSSDGMHGLIEDAEIAEVASMLPPEEAVQRLVDTSNARGGHDNITVVIGQVDEIDPIRKTEVPTNAVARSPTQPLTSGSQQADEERRPKDAGERPLSRIGLLLAGLLLILLVGSGVFFVQMYGGSATDIPTATVATTTATVAATTTTTTVAVTTTTTATVAVTTTATVAATTTTTVAATSTATITPSRTATPKPNPMIPPTRQP